MTAPVDAKAVAAGLTKAQRGAASALSDLWRAGPDLPKFVTDYVTGLRLVGLVERIFIDDGPPSRTGNADEIRVSFRSCWFFRLTPLGLAVRAHLTQEQPR